MCDKKCKECQYAKWSGFERTLIMRGKNKGQYKVIEFYKCTKEKEK